MDIAERSKVLLTEQEIAARIEVLAEQIAPVIDDETVCVCLLTGGMWFAADLMRALARRGRNPLFDAIWLSSYGNEQKSAGKVNVRASLQREVLDRQVLILDDVLDSGLSLFAAAALMREAGAGRVISAVFAAKPWPTPRALLPDFIAWDAPAEFLLGYGMDDAGRYRGLPDVRSVAV